MSNIRSALFLIALCSAFLMEGGSLHVAAETSKVPTKRILIPEDAPAAPIPGSESEKVVPDSGESDDSLAVPTDDLPSLTEPLPKQEADSNPEPLPIPVVETDLSKLPPAVLQTRKNLLDAARTGNIENLRPFISFSDHPTNLSLGGIDGDPIAYLKGISGDEEGRELLAILTEILEMGYVRMDAGTDAEIFVWPYFFAYPLDKLSPPQLVELFRILTAGDLQDSQEFGSYIFYRAGIRPDGTWSFFLAGD